MKPAQIIVTVSIAILSLSLTASPQNTVCFGINCPAETGDEALDAWAEEQQRMAELLFTRMNATLSEFGREERLACFSNCRKELNEIKALCKESNTFLTADTFAYDACIEYAKGRYQECLNPFSQCVEENN